MNFFRTTLQMSGTYREDAALRARVYCSKLSPSTFTLHFFGGTVFRGDEGTKKKFRCFSNISLSCTKDSPSFLREKGNGGAKSGVVRVLLWKYSSTRLGILQYSYGSTRVLPREYSSTFGEVLQYFGRSTRTPSQEVFPSRIRPISR